MREYFDGLVTRTMRNQGFIGAVKVTKFTAQGGVYSGTVRATYKGRTETYRAVIANGQCVVRKVTKED
jgi:hypothetical protein